MFPGALVSVSAGEPFGTAAELFATTAEPFATTAEPFATTAEPFATTAEPFATTAEPFATTAEPFATTAEPFATAGPRSGRGQLDVGMPSQFSYKLGFARKVGSAESAFSGRLKIAQRFIAGISRNRDESP